MPLIYKVFFPSISTFETPPERLSVCASTSPPLNAGECGEGNPMRPQDLHYFPFALPFVLGLDLLMGVVIALIEVGILEYAYAKIGVNRRALFAVLLLSLLGSYVNIPVAHLPDEQVITGRVITHFGMRYIIPMVQEWPGTVIAVNVGGAVVPTLLSLYLLYRHRLYVSALIGVVLVAVVVH